MSKFKKSKILCVALIIAIVATIIAPIGSFTAFADTQGDFTYTVSNGEATLTKYSGTAAELTLPTTLGGYPLTTIGTGAFESNSTLVTLNVPYGVTTIEFCAFVSCNALTTINLPNSLTAVYGQAFCGCEKLNNVVFPDSITYLGGVFYGCDSLTNVKLPSGIDTLVQGTFYWCHALETLTIPSNITTIEGRAITECHGLKTITIPKTVTSLNTQFVFYCKSLTSYVVSEENPNYASDNGVLYSKDKKTLLSIPHGKSGKFVVPDYVTTIGTASFAQCFDITDVVVGKQVSTIGYAAFSYTELKTIAIPENVTSIDETAFSHSGDDLIIYAVPGSYAYQYALDNDINVAELVEEVETIKSVSHEVVDGKIIFTVTTSAGDFNRVKVALGDDVKGYVAYSNSYTVNADGDYVWTLKTDAPKQTTNYAFDLRSSETGKYIREYYYYSAKILVRPDHNDSNNWNKVIDNIYTSQNGGLQMDTMGWKKYGRAGIALVPADVVDNGAAMTKAMYLNISSPYSDEEFATKSESYWEGVFGSDFDTFESTTINGFAAYKGYDTGSSYAWIINTPLNLYMIWFIQMDNDDLQSAAEAMMETVVIYDGGNNEVAKGIKSVSHEISGDKLIFTVITGAGDYDRVKVTLSDDLKGYIAYSSSYELNYDDDYVWTIKVDAPSETTKYSFDIRSSKTGKYLRDYFDYNNVEVYPVFKSVSHEISGDKIIFTVTTDSGNYNRVKLALSDDLKGYIAYSNNYTVNAKGDYVWTIKADAPTQTTSYAFDVRSNETGKYMREYFAYDVEVVDTFKSVSHDISNGKVIFTVTTAAGDYNRVKVALSSDPKGYIAYSSDYTVNADGDYVWTIKADAPVQTTDYVFDLRSSGTGKYIREYFEYSAEVACAIKSIAHKEVNGKSVFTVVTDPGYNRVKIVLADDVKQLVAFTSSYTVNSDGRCVWTIEIDTPAETTTYAFDLRSNETGAYTRKYIYFEV